MTTSPVTNGSEVIMAIKPELNVVASGTTESESANTKAIGKISGTDFEYWICKDKVVIGRNSSHGKVDVNIGLSSYVSRKHLQITYTRSRFFLQCIGKNGVFVDGQFQRLNAEPFPLDNACIIRFPSTSIQLAFSPFPPDTNRNGNTQSNKDTPPQDIASASDKKVPELPIKKSPIYIPGNLGKETPPNINPNQHFKYVLPRDVRGFLSAPPSPTGTISAVNSCPSSPRSSHMRNQNNNVTENLNAAATAIAASVGDIPSDKISQQDPVDSKPPYSYAQLIIQAISSAPHRQLTLSGIYAHITKNYPYYRTADKGWQNSIRHNLSLNRYFVKVPRSQEESGKGSFWKVDPASERKLVEQAWRKRRQRSVPCFCAPLTSTISTVTRSAPVSPEHPNTASPPTHVTSSQESDNGCLHPVENNSKIHFLHLPNRYAQSAPGSPSNGATISMSSTTNSEILQHHTTAIPQPSAKMVWPVQTQGSHVNTKVAIDKDYQSGIIYHNDATQFHAPGMEVPKQLSIVMQPPNQTNQSLSQLTPQQFQQQVVMVTGSQTQGVPLNIGTIVASPNTVVASGGVPFMVPGNPQFMMKRPADTTPITTHKKVKTDIDQSGEDGSAGH
ncbi:transcription factor protein [Ciona intestinalis]